MSDYYKYRKSLPLTIFQMVIYAVLLVLIFIWGVKHTLI